MKESHIRVTYDHEYVLVVVVTIPSSFPLSWLNTRYLTTVAPKNATHVAETACRSGTHKVTPDLYWGSICSFCRFQSSTLSTVVCPFVLFLLTVVSCALLWSYNFWLYFWYLQLLLKNIKINLKIIQHKRVHTNHVSQI